MDADRRRQPLVRVPVQLLADQVVIGRGDGQEHAEAVRGTDAAEQRVLVLVPRLADLVDLRQADDDAVHRRLERQPGHLLLGVLELVHRLAPLGLGPVALLLHRARSVAFGSPLIWRS